MKIHILSQKTAEYKIRPKVSLCGKETEYTIKGLGIETAFEPHKEYSIMILPLEENSTAVMLDYIYPGTYDEFTVTANEKSELKFSRKLEKEQIYTVRITDITVNKRIVDLQIYSAKQDLWERTPMKGDAHVHCCHSVDGQEDPVVAASVYRKAGFDYLAITDHHKVDGSVYAIEHMKDIPTEMALYYGEEVHVPNAYIHAINVGALLDGRVGLDKWYHEHEDEVNKEVDKIAEQARAELPAEIEPYDFAWRKWIADTVHKNGGIAIVAHPFWEYDAHNTRNAMFRYIAQTKLFDGAEILHGQDDYESVDANRQVAFWNDMRADGIYISPVGASDSHRRSFHWTSPSDFNNAYTVLFAKTSSFDGFAEAVKSGYTAAVECYGDAPNHVVATYRLTVYTHFLLKEYFPLHDELCFEEGCRIKDAYLGDEKSTEVLKLINGRVRRFADEFFGR